MHLRKVVLACVLASAFVANVASALGLGEIKLKSTLNQPLNAEIQLLDTRDLNASQIIIALGSPADFERNGVERLFFYTEFQFEVVLDNPGGAIIKVTTTNPVREPYLNFLVEARWSAGRLLREYTMLMDLPTFNEAAPQAVEAPQTNVQSQPSLQPVAQDTPHKVERAPVEQPVVEAPKTETPASESEATGTHQVEEAAPKKSKVAAGTYGPITQGETLWEIAQAVRPDNSVSVYQTMLALQRLNPEAFIRNNVNLIKKGQVLRIPDAAEASNLSQREALAEFNSQTSEWSALVNNANNATAAAPTNLQPELDATRHKATSHTSQEPEQGRVKLAAPGASDSSSGQGSGANKGKGKALQKELASTLEELDKAKSENSELNSRVNDLETQTKTMQKLVDVSNDKLRAMQVNAAKAEQKKSSASSVAQSSAAEISAAAVSSLAKASAPAIKKHEPVKPVAPEPSLMDMVMDNISYIALGLLVVILGGLFLVRRNKANAEQKYSRSATDNIFEPEPSFDHLNNFQDDDHFDEHEEPEPIEEDIYTEAETDDPAGESEIYISLGQYDRAEDILLKGLAKDPNSSEIRLKLLEVYSHEQNAPEFDKHYKALLPFAGATMLARAKELRGNIPGLSLLDEPASAPKITARPSTFVEEKPLAEAKEIPVRSAFTPVSTPAVTDDDLLDIDLDLDDDHTAQHEPVESEEFSFDLSDDDTSTAHHDDDHDLSFDLDLDAPAHEKPEELAEDLSHISLAIDDMDEKSALPNLDLEPAESAESDEEFSFDFNELDEEPEDHEPVVAEPVRAPVAEVKTNKAADDANDDFDLDMDMDDLDLAALDKEMESLDADLDLSETESTPQSRNFEKLRDALDDVDVVDDVDDDAHQDLDIDQEPIAEPVESSPTKIRKFDLATEPMTVEDSHEDDVFNEALSDFNSEEFNADGSAHLSDDEMDSELDFMADADEAATKLDLARAYIDMGDNDGARDILAEVVLEGNDQQKSEAEQLLNRIGHA